MERLKLDIVIDHDYVAHVDLCSTMRKDQVSAELFDLEFTIRFPKETDKPHKVTDNDNEDIGGPSGDLLSAGSAAHAGKVRLRSNIASEPAWHSVPGDLVEMYRPSWFDERLRNYSDWQYQERVYYKHCPYCHRSRYEYQTTGCSDPRCLWRRAYPAHQAARRDTSSQNPPME